MQLHVIESAQRRMLLEMLASERSGEEALVVGALFGREQIAESLRVLGMCVWVGPDEICFTRLGRHVAESLALRLIARDTRASLGVS
jgi:hypothetical protein